MEKPTPKMTPGVSVNPHLWQLNPITESTSVLDDLRHVLREYIELQKRYPSDKNFYKLGDSLYKMKNKYKL